MKYLKRNTVINEITVEDRKMLIRDEKLLKERAHKELKSSILQTLNCSTHNF